MNLRLHNNHTLDQKLTMDCHPVSMPLNETGFCFMLQDIQKTLLTYGTNSLYPFLGVSTSKASTLGDFVFLRFFHELWCSVLSSWLLIEVKWQGATIVESLGRTFLAKTHNIINQYRRKPLRKEFCLGTAFEL